MNGIEHHSTAYMAQEFTSFIQESAINKDFLRRIYVGITQIQEKRDMLLQRT